jgi:DNA-binding NarL/FixJ family response regulator
MRQSGLTPDANYPSPASVSRDRLSVLRTQVARSVVDGAADGPGALIGEVISVAIEAFVASRANVAEAVTRVAPLLDKVGCREAHRQPDASRLHHSFKLASVAVQRGLIPVVGDLMAHDALMQLRQDLMVYLAQLHRIAMAGFDRTSRLVSLTPDERLAELRAIVFSGASPRDVDQLAATIGFNPGQRVTPIVSVHHVLPDEILNHPQVLIDDSRTMALLAEEWEPHLSAVAFHGQAVLGPPSTVAQCHEAVALTRNAATLLRDGTVIDARVVVPSIDLLGELLVRGNRLLADLLIDKHLSPLETLAPARRIALAQMLLVSLERGLPLNRIARDLGVAAQTVHNRMNALRSLLGAKLDDADQRLELIVALRAALIRWNKA